MESQVLPRTQRGRARSAVPLVTMVQVPGGKDIRLSPVLAAEGKGFRASADSENPRVLRVPACGRRGNDQGGGAVGSAEILHGTLRRPRRGRHRARQEGGRDGGARKTLGRS